MSAGVVVTAVPVLVTGDRAGSAVAGSAAADPESRLAARPGIRAAVRAGVGRGCPAAQGRYLVISAPGPYHRFFDDDFTVEYPTGSGTHLPDPRRERSSAAPSTATQRLLPGRPVTWFDWSAWTTTCWSSPGAASTSGSPTRCSGDAVSSSTPTPSSVLVHPADTPMTAADWQDPGGQSLTLYLGRHGRA